MSLFLGAKTLAKAKSELAAKEGWLTSLANAEPAPTQAVADALAREFAELRNAVGQAESLWRDNSITRALCDSPPPPNSRAAYFEIARYRQALAGLAGEQGIEIAQDEFFGFRAYANVGPSEADILRVYTQRLGLERVLGALFRSKPQRLLAVIREERNASPEAPWQDESGSADASYRFQIRFLGTTAVLRTWLNELASDRLPVLVRSVTVEPGAERQVIPDRGRPTAALSLSSFGETGDSDGFELLVRPSGSEFLVTLDYVELGAEEEVEALTEGFSRFSENSPERVMTWPAPESQVRGPQWIFDVFTPPEIFYHPAEQQFRVKALRPSADPALTAHALPDSQNGELTVPRLLGVRREDYPLQLSGYIGGAGSDGLRGDCVGPFLGLFENRESGELLLLRGGDRVESLGIEVLDFRVEMQSVAHDEGTPFRAPRAVARIRDVQGERRSLYEGERAEGHALIAEVEWYGERLELREGDVVAGEEGALLTVSEIQCAPQPRAVMKSHATAPESEWLVFTLESAPAGSPH
ncbi:Amuc_1100 family pilus-like protein [Cephaloticoccus capnophilus]|uniref:Amuc_1100 family pilus-like protein n=1 Tax=Cephaloticoccus capnophilus TaxID=1548208 RepID=UPI0012E8CE1D